MIRFIFRRFWQGLIVLFILSIVIFFFTRVTGNPVDLLLPMNSTQEDREILTEQLGLDEPYHIQFVNFLGQLVRGDLGTSIRYQKPVTELYFARLPNTIKLIGVGMIFAVIAAVPMGVIAASRRGTWIDQIIRLIAVIGIAAPSFWVGLVLINIFSVRLGVLPVSRMGGFEHYILPAFSMCLLALAAMVRLLRSSVVETLDSDFVKLALIKGVSPTVVLWRHCLRNALVPVVTILGMYVGILIGGSIVIESIFAWPGAGRLAYDGIMARDYPLVQGVILLHATLIVIINFLTDILYSYIDPRIRYE